MKLGKMERVGLLNLIPKEGDIKTLRVLKELFDAVNFTDADRKAEREQIDFKAEAMRTGTPYTDDVDVLQKEVQVGKVAQEIMKQLFIKLDKDKKLQMGHMSLYERFVEWDELDEKSAVRAAKG